jgi:hypothetical protein
MCLVIIIFKIKDSCSKLVHICSSTFSLKPLLLLLLLLCMRLLDGHCDCLATAAAAYSATAASRRRCCLCLSMR